eukprot:CAMPEP_0171569948 /NCGR_PEP_ID=MMETSP0961-20121227/2655_1 /TAXON_ID=87120 /ORGANISM="Aurantiochytrium limacinum, Strain ATCCMYA-1381" /LENGTH=943 /DNA_ID=CAMNT_0012124349 /DNA_START=120 /DNA_END=2951 /DNA_ORIENTATION=+
MDSNSDSKKVVFGKTNLADQSNTANLENKESQVHGVLAKLKPEVKAKRYENELQKGIYSENRPKSVKANCGDEINCSKSNPGNKRDIENWLGHGNLGKETSNAAGSSKKPLIETRSTDEDSFGSQIQDGSQCRRSGRFCTFEPVNLATKRSNVLNHLLCWGEVPFRTCASSVSRPSDYEKDRSMSTTSWDEMTYVLDPASALNTQSIRAVGCFGNRLLVVSNEGDVYESGPQGIELQQALAGERALGGVRIASVSCGPTFSLAVTSFPSGDVFSWGKGLNGELGHGPDRCEEPHPRRIAGLLHEFVCQTACGERHALARTRIGTVFSWGFGGSGQLGHRRASIKAADEGLSLYEPCKVQSIPMRPIAPNSTRGPFKNRIIVYVSAGLEHSVILDDDGAVMCFGSSTRGQCGVEATPESFVWAPQLISMPSDDEDGRVVQVECGDTTTAARTDRGIIFTWGDNSEGDLGRDTPTEPCDHLPGRLELIDPSSKTSARATWVSLGGHHGAAVLADGGVMCWGQYMDGEILETPANEHGSLMQEAVRRDSSVEGRRMVFSGDKYCVYVENVNDDVDWSDVATFDEQAISSLQPKHLPEALAHILEQENAETLRRKRWHEKVLNNWPHQREKKRTKLMWKAGIPAPLRTIAWPLALGNGLHITKPLYYAFKASAKQPAVHAVPDSPMSVYGNAFHPEATETDTDADYSRRLDVPRATCELIDADLPRTFPSLKMFAQTGPLGKRLRNVLKAFAHYRPDMGYVQGMSYLAAVICLNTASEYLAFQTLANLLMKEHLFAFFRLDQTLIFQYYEIFERALTDYPETTTLGEHLSRIGAHPHLYLYNWLQTLFCKVLPLDLASRVFDCFLWDGTAFCIRAAVAIISLFRQKLNNAPFETCIQLLSCSPGQEDFWQRMVVDHADQLFTICEDVSLAKDLVARLRELNNQVYYS